MFGTQGSQRSEDCMNFSSPAFENCDMESSKATLKIPKTVSRELVVLITLHFSGRDALFDLTFIVELHLHCLFSVSLSAL